MSNALQLATYTLEGGQVLNAETVKNYFKKCRKLIPDVTDNMLRDFSF